MPKKQSTIKIMASGVFDLLHPGHIYYLEQAKALGDHLTVVVANDAVVMRTKGRPLFDAGSRRHLVAALSCVDEVVIPAETEPTRYYRTVLAINPDIIALGHDQAFDTDQLAAELGRYGWQGQIVRIGRFEEGSETSTPASSSQLKKRLRENDSQKI